MESGEIDSPENQEENCLEVCPSKIAGYQRPRLQERHWF
jgi:hypothetical protein